MALSKYDPSKPKLQTRYNKGLVCGQLRAIFTYSNDEELWDDQAKVYAEWCNTTSIIPDRPRFINIRSAFGLDQDYFIMVSNYSECFSNGMKYTIMHITHTGYIKFGVPMSNDCIDLLGGAGNVARIIAYSGVVGLCYKLNELLTRDIDYLVKEVINANLDYLNEIKEGIVHEI